jgi:hypothetical protein
MMIDQFNNRLRLRNRQTDGKAWAEDKRRGEACQAVAESIGSGAAIAAIQESILDFLGGTLSYHRPIEYKFETVVELLEHDPVFNVTELAKAILTTVEGLRDEK